MSTKGRVCVAVGESLPNGVAIYAAFECGTCVCVCLRACMRACVRRRSVATVGGGSSNTASKA